MISAIKKIAVSLTVAACAVFMVAPQVLAETPQEALCRGAQGSGGAGTCAGSGPTLMATIGAITNILLYIAGAVAVIMIIIGGVRYATSQGDQSGISGAKNTILYAVIGLIVTIAAYAIVNFVLINL